MRATAFFFLFLAVGLSAPSASAEPSWNDLFPAFEIRGTLGLSAGADSNPDEVPEPEASGFGRLDGEIHVEIGEGDGFRAFADAEGAAQTYTDGSLGEEYRYEVDIELRQPLGETLEFSLGAERAEDTTDDPPTTSHDVWGQMAVETAIVLVELRGTIRDYREDMPRAEIVADDLEVFDERAYSVRLRSQLNIGAPIRPMAEARVSAVDYLERRPGKPARDAIEYSLAAGVAVDINDGLAVQLGLRRNERFFEAEDAGSHSNFGPDLEVEWSPNDRVHVLVWMYRGFAEPSFEDGLIRDLSVAGIEWSYDATDRLRFDGGLGAADEEEVGTDYHKLELDGYAEGRFALRDGVDLLLGAYFDHEIRYDDPGDGFTRVAARAGLEASF